MNMDLEINNYFIKAPVSVACLSEYPETLRYSPVQKVTSVLNIRKACKQLPVIISHSPVLSKTTCTAQINQSTIPSFFPFVQ